MKNHLLLIAVLLAALVDCYAQNTPNLRPNSVSFELGKNGLIYNAYYDHRFQGKDYGLRFGIGSNLAQFLNAKSVGLGGYYLFGKRNDHFELGAELQYQVIDEVSDDQVGFAIVYPDYTTRGLATFLNLGYRHYGRVGIFRCGLSPGTMDGKFLPGGYFSYGICF